MYVAKTKELISGVVDFSGISTQHIVSVKSSTLILHGTFLDLFV